MSAERRRSSPLVCREHFADGYCLRPATFIVGPGVTANRLAGYPACDGCALFWAKDCRYELSQRDHELLEVAAAWANVPTSKSPSKTAALAHRQHRHRRRTA